MISNANGGNGTPTSNSVTPIRPPPAMAMRLSDDNDDAVSSKIAYQTVNVRGEVPYSSGWFPNDGRVAVVVLFDLGIIIIIVGVSRP